MEKYRNRQEAGLILSTHLKSYAKRTDVIVLALPRGGVPVAFEIAKALMLPLDVFIVRKLGVPGHEELAMGALAMDGAVIFNQDIVNNLGVSKQSIQEVIEREEEELKRRDVSYRGNLPFPNLAQKTIILIDDGIATGASMRAAVRALNRLKPISIVIAVPVAETTTCESIAKEVDKVICPLKPPNFYAVGQWYEDFSQTSDDEVRILLKQAKEWLQ